MSRGEARQFDRDGYLLVQDIMTVAQAAQLRELFLTKFNLPPEPQPHGDTDSTRVEIFARYPEVRWLLFNERILSLFRTLAGEDFVLLPESFVALSNFVQWHKDTTAWERRGRERFARRSRARLPRPTRR